MRTLAQSGDWSRMVMWLPAKLTHTGLTHTASVEGLAMRMLCMGLCGALVACTAVASSHSSRKAPAHATVAAGHVTPGMSS